VPPCWVPVGGSSAAGAHSRLGSAGGGLVWESGSLGCEVCIVFFSLSVSLLLFPLFAVLLNCPYHDPPFSACFLPFSSAHWWGEGRPRGAFVASHSQTITEANPAKAFVLFPEIQPLEQAYPTMCLPAV